MQLITTADGSHTLYSEQFNEVYHSRHGALQEAKHVYITQGFSQCTAQPLRVFEVGFGTGLNALLTLLQAENDQRSVEYTTIEVQPLSIETIKQLNYTQLLGFAHCYGAYHTLHLCKWNEPVQIKPGFVFQKLQQSLLQVPLPPAAFDLIYFDAFAPEHQPEMWTTAVFAKLYEAAAPGGLLVTYCAKGSVQRSLKDAGWQVQKRPGPPGKREMIAALKQ